MATVGAKERTSWGAPVFVLAILIGFASLWIWRTILDRSIGYESVLASFGAVGALTASYLSHSAYPRVHNLKVYVLGIGIATSSLLAMLLVFGLPQVFDFVGSSLQSAALFSAYAGALLVLLTTVVMPDYASFAATRRSAGIVVAILVGWSVVLLASVSARDVVARQLTALRTPDSTLFWIFNAAAASIVLLTIFREAHSLGIGGIHAGSTALLVLGWVYPSADIVLHGILQAALPMFLSLAILVHWFLRLENRVWYDPLLRIYNRAWLDQVIEDQSTINTKPPFSIALIDLDHFKAINDTHGHDAGDVVLRETAQRIRSLVVPTGTVARFGGEEIVCLFPRTGLERATETMETVRKSLEENPVAYKKKRIPVTASIGIAGRDSGEQSLGIVMQGADKALYSAKKSGRNCIRTSRLRRKAQ